MSDIMMIPFSNSGNIRLISSVDAAFPICLPDFLASKAQTASATSIARNRMPNRTLK